MKNCFKDLKKLMLTNVFIVFVIITLTIISIITIFIMYSKWETYSYNDYYNNRIKISTNKENGYSLKEDGTIQIFKNDEIIGNIIILNNETKEAEEEFIKDFTIEEKTKKDYKYKLFKMDNYFGYLITTNKENVSVLILSNSTLENLKNDFKNIYIR